jgi:hypothetical protein
MRSIKRVSTFIILCAFSTSMFARDYPIVHPNEIIAKYGKPDSTQSSEYEKPRPPLVTRMLEYKKERVRFTFLPTAKIGSPPPYKSWYLLGTQDPNDNAVISADEAARRMQSRAKK